MPNGTPAKVSHSISTETILRVALVFLALAFAWAVRDIIALLFVCLIAAAALDPTVDFLQKFNIPRAVGVVLIYIVVIALFTLIVIGISLPLKDEVVNFSNELPTYYREIERNFQNFQTSSLITPERVNNFKGSFDEMLLNLSKAASGNLLPFLSAIFGGLISIMLALVITFYFTIQEGALKLFAVWLVPKEREPEVLSIIEKIQEKLGWWLRGQLLLSLIIFLITYVGLKVIGVKYALVLALLAGFFEMVPYLGPILSAVPAVFLTLISPWGGFVKALIVILLYVIIQQAENNFIVPKVMSKTVGLNPLVVIFSILIGAKIAGVVGAIIAVPVAAAITVYLHEKGYKKELVA